MAFRTVLLAVAAALTLSMSGAALAQDPTPAEIAASQARVKVATGLVALGRAEQDAMMLVVGARLLSGVGSVEGSNDASPAYDVAAILEEATGFAGDDQYLLDAIAAVSTARADRRAGAERYCNWYQDCGYSIVDPFACQMVQVCN